MADSEEYLKKLEQYVNKRLEKGHKPEHIKKDLLEHGWQEHHINRFLEKRDKEEYERFEEESKEKGKMVVEEPKEIVDKNKEKESSEIKVTSSFIHETEFDKLYNLVQEKGKVKIEDVMKIFKIDKKLAEKWADILKKAGLVDVYEPAMGNIEIRKRR